MIQEIIRSLEYTLGFVEKSVADLSDEQMVLQPPSVPNHGAWTIGHLIFSCQELAVELGTDAWLPEEWEIQFGFGSTPFPESSNYLAKSQMLSLLVDSSQRLRQVLEATAESEMVQSLPDETFRTKGELFTHVIVGHTAYHAGQLAVWRRAIGQGSAAVFI